jgi:hypothetical protein
MREDGNQAEDWRRLRHHHHGYFLNRHDAVDVADVAGRKPKLVAISLGEEDDAQVIFETLNGRGAELNATDLIRNFIFMRADREGADSASLYDTFWIPFEGSFRSESQRRGRLKRPRLEWFVQTALQAELADNVEIGRIYTGYRRYGLGQKSPVTAEKQLGMSTRHADYYRQLASGSGADPIARFGKRMAVWDASPTHALALRVASVGLSPEPQTQIFDDIVSYIVRRAICGLTIKNYNNVFLRLLTRLTGAAVAADAFCTALSGQKADASRWPRDDEIQRAWLQDSAHNRLGELARVRTILSELENGLRSPRAEEAFTPSAGMLDVDHILPEKWYPHWPVNGQAVTAEEASNALLSAFGVGELSPRIEAINRREKMKAAIGNLTLVSMD